MKLLKNAACMICALAVFCAAVANPVITEAAADTQMQVNAKAGKNYKKLYKKFLEKGKITGTAGSNARINWYYMINLNKSGAPELITIENGGGMATYHIYTISGKKVKKCGECTTRGISSNPPTFDYVSKYKAIRTSGWTNGIGGDWANLFQVSGKGKLVHKYHARSASYPKAEYYTGTTDMKCKKVGKAAYKRFCRKYFAKARVYEMIQNTAANRAKTFGK